MTSNSKILLNQTIQVLGKVEQDMSISEMDSVLFKEYDINIYNEMVHLTLKHPQLFGI